LIKLTSLCKRESVTALAALGLMLATQHAGAATAMEEKIFKAPMPHAQYGEGATVKADYARLETDRTASKLGPKLAPNPRINLETCVADRQKRGLPVNPPRAYPSFDRPTHIDTYIAANRKISYVRAYTFRINMDDCSLIEGEDYRATLTSAAGSCQFDLIARKAKGDCDLAAHRAAPAKRTTAPAPDAMQARLAEMEADPRRAAAAAQVRKLMANVPAAASAAAPGGPKKSVLGIECDVARGPGGTSACTSKSGLVLENAIDGVSESKAVQAGQAAQVNEAVFDPLGAAPTANGGAK